MQARIVAFSVLFVLAAVLVCFGLVVEGACHYGSIFN
jgi:hypothetical protein